MTYISTTKTKHAHHRHARRTAAIVRAPSTRAQCRLYYIFPEHIAAARLSAPRCSPMLQIIAQTNACTYASV
eukprot:2891894-Pleurochrysis_carterae.AAC.1